MRDIVAGLEVFDCVDEVVAAAYAVVVAVIVVGNSCNISSGNRIAPDCTGTGTIDYCTENH